MRRTVLFTFATFVLMISCCTQQHSETEEPTIVHPSIALLSATTSPTFTPTPQASATLRSIEPTLHPGPTLTTNESQSMISKFMQRSQSCLFPCWWGIVPGKSPWAYTNSLLTYLNLKSSSIELPEGKSYASMFASNGDLVYGSVSFTVSSNIVEDIKIHGVKESDPNFANRWAYYSLTEILKTYGPPSQFWTILVDGGEIGDSRNSYYLLIFYDEIKALISYSGSSTSDVLCPDFVKREVGWLDIYLQTPDKSRRLTDITDVSNVIELLDQPDVQRVEKMTKSRIIELYDLFTQSQEPACFKVSVN